MSFKLDQKVWGRYYIIILMSHLQSKELQAQISWMRQVSNYSKMGITDLQQDNKKVLAALKALEVRLDRQLQTQKYSRVGGGGQEQQQADQLKVTIEAIKSNEQCIRILQKELTKLKERRGQLTDGLQSKLNAKKHDLEKRIGQCKAELKKLKLEQNQINKRLSSTRQNPSEPESLAEHARLQQQLRVFSIKYVKILDKYNRVAEQLSLSVAGGSGPDLQIPQELYDKQLEQREQAQFKEYQGIVKMCTILSKRNDSEANKYNRLYGQKLKELEKTIINLGQIDRMIALKEGDILEGKKNLELIKFRAGSGDRDKGEEMMSVSHAHLRRASYSTTRLPIGSKMMRERDMSQAVILPKSLSTRKHQP